MSTAVVFHPDCDRCCAVGLCHWCLRPSVTMGMLKHADYHYLACGESHAAYLSAHTDHRLSPGVVHASGIEGIAR